MSFVFPFATSLQVSTDRSSSYLCAYVVSDIESCFIRYLRFNEYDDGLELDAFRILSEAVINGHAKADDIILLDAMHDAMHEYGLNFIVEPKDPRNDHVIHFREELFKKDSGDNVITISSHGVKLSKDDIKSFSLLNELNFSTKLLNPNDYALSLMKEIVLKNAFRDYSYKETLNTLINNFDPHKTVSLFDDLFDGPFYLPYDVAITIYESLDLQYLFNFHSNRFDSLRLILPECYRHRENPPPQS